MSDLPVLELYRVPSQENGTAGILCGTDHYPICNTLERPWMDNKQGISSIPCGVYVMNRVIATAKIPYEHFLLSGVVGREGIAIHKGNTMYDVEGCILLGTSFGRIAGTPAVLQSGVAYDLFMQRMGLTQQARIVIKEIA